MDLTSERRIRPAAALRHDIQMAQNRCHLLSLSVLDPANPVIHAPGPKAQFPAQLQRMFQRALRSFPVRSFRRGLSLYAPDLNAFPHGCQDFFLHF